jgi:hypothetical protein
LHWDKLQAVGDAHDKCLREDVKLFGEEEKMTIHLEILSDTLRVREERVQLVGSHLSYKYYVGRNKA